MKSHRSSNTHSGGDDFSLDKWLERLKSSYPEDQLERIREAAVMAMVAHKHQKRASGEPYISHIFAVADILIDLHLDYESVIAALLHDVVEDTEVTLEQVESIFGHSVSQLVDGVTKMQLVKEIAPAKNGKTVSKWSDAESLRKMLLAMVEDVRVILIKLADRLHNMRTLKYLSEQKQKKIAHETLEIFAPLANRMGIWQIKWELEDLSFRYLKPDEYRNIAALLDERRLDRESFINQVVTTLKQEFDRQELTAEVTGRPKHIYSIWRKMERKGVAFSDIFDVSAVRVLVNSIADCYAALGIVHSLWRHIPKEFDDYIATPKGNNYQSLHTAVVGPDGKTVEIQIRTHEMHEKAELGLASHWRYKEGGKYDPGYEKKITWLRQLLEWKEEESGAEDFVDRFRSEVVEDRVYVLTPKGNVVDLSAGATPLDFAYHIHTELGHRCRGAKVNGSIVPLTYTLKTGDQVDILSSKSGEPSRDWLNPHTGYLKTSRARSKVRTWFTHVDMDKNIQAGKSMFERELSRLDIHDFDSAMLLKRYNHQSMKELYAAIGRGDINEVQIASALQDIVTPKNADTEILRNTPLHTPKEVQGDVSIHGVGNLLTSMARCCKPAPGDPIVGYITKGRGVTIHRSDCANVLRHGRERLVEVSWGTRGGTTYPVDIAVLAYDRQGLLRDITGILSDEKVNVIGMNTITDIKDHKARMKVTVEVDGVSQLSRVLSKINQLSNVLDAKRSRQ